ncbi:MAG: hypothetical protein ABI670_04865 [Chloroflexota bacterium]
MIHESRKWRLLIRILALVMTSVLMLAVAGPVSYALQDDTPKEITSAGQLFDKNGKPLADSFAHVEAVPDINRTVPVGEGSSTHYWIPVRGFDNLLFVRSDKGQYLFPYDYDPETGFAIEGKVRYSGKITTLKGQPDDDKAIEELQKQGIIVDKESAMVLLQGEAPATYRPIVPVMPLLAIFWALALVGAWQIWRGRRPRRNLAHSTY